MKNIFKRFFTDSCIIFTAFVFILLCAYNLLVPPTAGIVSGLSLQTAILLYICAFLFRIFHTVLYLKKFSFAFRLILNYALVMTTSFVVFKLIGIATNKHSNDLVTFVLLTFFALIYTATIALIHVVKSKKGNKDNKEYKPITK